MADFQRLADRLPDPSEPLGASTTPEALLPETRACDLLATLAELCAGLESSPDPREGVRSCLRALAETLSLRGAALWEAGAEDLILLAQHGLPGSWAEAAGRLKADGPLAAAASGRRGVVILPGAPGLPPVPGARGAAGAAAAASLRVGTRTVGLLVALAETPEVFGEEVRGLLEAAAPLLAGALVFAQRLRQAISRAERLEDLTRVAQHLVALLDVESLPQAIAEEAARFLGAEAAVFRVLEGEHLRLLAQTGGAEGAIAWRDPIRVGESLSGTVAAQGQPLAISDLAGETRLLPSHREAVLGRGYRAYLGLPLFRSGRLVGVLSLYAREIGAFGPEDVRLGMRLAEQVALALEKAELLQRERRQGDRLRALSALTRAVGGSLDLQEIFRQVVAAAAELLEVPFARLWLLDESGEELHARAEVMDRTLTEGAQRRLAVGTSLIGAVAREGQPLAVHDVLGDPRWQNREWARRHGLMSLLATPLVLGGKVRGVLSVLSRAPRRFGEEEQALMAALAQHAAIAIQNAQFLDEARSAAARLRTLTQLGRVIAGSLEPGTVFEAIVGAAGELLEVPHTVLWLQEASGETLRQQAEHLTPGATVGRQRLPVGLALATTAVESGGAVLVPALATDPRVGSRMAEDPDGGLAFAAVPLRLHRRVLGALGVFSPLPGRLDAQAMDLLAYLADHAAVAIKNAQLYKEANRKAEQTAALARIARTLAGSLDLPQVFAAVVEAAVAHTGDAVAALWVLESDGALSLGASSGFSHPEVRRQTRFRVGEGIVGEVAERREVLLVSDVQADPRLVNRELAEAEGLRANAGLPLLVGERCVGVLDLKRRSARAFSAEELTVLTSLADHAAIAIANARLYQEARRRAERLAAMAAVARTLTASLEERAVFECIVRAAMDLLGGDMARLWIHDDDRGLLRVAAGAGVPDFPLPPRDAFAPGEGLVGTVFAERTLRVVVDPEREPLYAQQAWAAAAGVRAAAGVPVLMGERALGVLSVVFRKQPQLGVEELNLLTSFANQAAVAMENARLYQHLKDYSAGLEEKVRERTAALEAANLQLTEANRLKSAFLANMSHELRTPLNSIIGFSEVLEDGTFGPLTDRQRLYVQNILSSGRHLLSLISDILDLSKIEAGKMELRLGRFPVGQALAEAMEVIRGQALEKSITLTLEAEAGLPDLTGDAGKFRQICFNLLSNAVKFTPDGGRVSVSARAISLEGPHGPVPAVEVTVADTGIGIEAADQERIFREFEQVDGSYARKYAGTGLGLALTRRLVELHGGTIRVESAGPERGSTFRVRLPVRPPVLEGDILVVDDDAELLQALTETFTRLGYGVRAAQDGEEALEAVATARPDCLILDLHLPRRSGLEVLQALREQAGTRGIPVVALTGWGEQEGREALQLGAREFLTKPVSPSVLAATVDRLVQAGARERRR